MSKQTLAQLAAAAAEIAIAAGRAILKVYKQDFDVVQKADQSPLTQADLASHRLIRDALGKLTPDIPLLSEERARPGPNTGWSIHWMEPKSSSTAMANSP